MIGFSTMHCPSIHELTSPPQNKLGWPWIEESPQLPDKMNDGSSWPSISIIMPSYNQADFIEATIRSILLQSYPKIEIIIIDGGSTDSSLDIINKYAPWITYCISEKDKGQSHAINKGISYANGDLLHWINSDDILLPKAFSTVAKLYCANTDVRLVTGQSRIIDATDQPAGELISKFTTWYDYASRKNTIRQVSTFFDRQLFDELGMIDESLEYSMDVDILLRFTSKYPPLITKTYLSSYRKHDSTKFDNNFVEGYKEGDTTFLRHITDNRLKQDFIKWSASNWFRLAINADHSFKSRFMCFIRAIKWNYCYFFKRNQCGQQFSKQ